VPCLSSVKKLFAMNIYKKERPLLLASLVL
jgi:hypothetical protein